MSLGGIGTGTVSLGERDDLRDWEIMNRSSKGFVPKQGDSWFGAGPSFYSTPVTKWDLAKTGCGKVRWAVR